MLAMVDLSGNQIEEIGDLVQHKFLECLILSSNKISKISGLESLKYLQVNKIILKLLQNFCLYLYAK